MKRKISYYTLGEANFIDVNNFVRKNFCKYDKRSRYGYNLLFNKGFILAE